MTLLIYLLMNGGDCRTAPATPGLLIIRMMMSMLMVTVEMCPYLEEVCQTQSMYESLVSIRKEGCLGRKREEH